MSEIDTLRASCCEANKRLHTTGLVDITFGNLSVLDRRMSRMAIKPSGVAYEELTPESIVVVDLTDGRSVSGNLRPSSDAPTHRRLYQGLGDVECIVHTHSRFATAFAQAGISVPCLGTTHADYFRSAVPVTRHMSEEEVNGDYEWETGKVILEAVREDVPGVLVRGHGAFVWGKDWETTIETAVALELVADLAHKTLSLSGDAFPLPQYLVDKHYSRKHGPGRYYGQND